MPEGYYVGVPLSSLVYIGVPDRAEFDKIGAEAHDHGLDKNGNHVITKCVEGPGNEPGRPVKVIFQHWAAQESVEQMCTRLAQERRQREAAQIIADNARCSRCGAKLDGSEECGQADCPHTQPEEGKGPA